MKIEGSKSTNRFGSAAWVILAAAGTLIVVSAGAVAADYVNGKRCAGDAWETKPGVFKCRLVGGGVEEGAGSSGPKPTVKTPKTPKSPHIPKPDPVMESK